MSQKHSFTVYLKHAFMNTYNYIGLGAAAVLALAFRQPGWLYLGAAGELVYLYMCLTSERFMRHVDSQLGQEAELDIEPLRAHVWPLIANELRERYNSLEQLTGRFKDETAATLRERDPFYVENRRKIKVLLANYLKIALAVTRYNEYLKDVDPEEIKENIARLEKEIPAAAERVQEVKRKNIDVLTKRLDKLEKAVANRDYLHAQMETIEDTMKLVVDQAITLTDPKGMGLQIDNLLMNLQETELIAAEMDAYTELEQGMLDEVVSLPRERD